MTNQNTETSNPATAELQAIDGRICSVPDQLGENTWACFSSAL